MNNDAFVTLYTYATNNVINIIFTDNKMIRFDALLIEMDAIIKQCFYSTNYDVIYHWSTITNKAVWRSPQLIFIDAITAHSHQHTRQSYLIADSACGKTTQNDSWRFAFTPIVRKICTFCDFGTDFNWSLLAVCDKTIRRWMVNANPCLSNPHRNF